MRASLLTGACLALGLLACGGGGASAGTAAPVGVLWHLERIQMMDDTELRPEDPSQYTLELAADGSVAVRADCNRGAGRYTIDGVELRIGPLGVTRALCPPGSLDTRYLQLDIAASWMIRDGQLAIATAMDSAILFFAPAP